MPATTLPSIVFACALSLAPLALAEQEDEALKAKAVTLISKLYDLDRDSVVIVSLVKSQAIEGAKELTIRTGNKRATLYLFGGKIIVGRAYDLDYDPYQENLKKISLKDRPIRGSGPVLLVEYSDFQ